MSTSKHLLKDIAYARSGDKGSSANIGILAYDSRGFNFLRSYLTEEKVHQFFSSLGVTETKRYELENLEAFNFVLKGVLKEGGSRSLRTDSQGKVLGQALLLMEIEEEAYVSHFGG